MKKSLLFLCTILILPGFNSAFAGDEPIFDKHSLIGTSWTGQMTYASLEVFNASGAKVSMGGKEIQELLKKHREQHATKIGELESKQEELGKNMKDIEAQLKDLNPEGDAGKTEGLQDEGMKIWGDMATVVKELSGILSVSGDSSLKIEENKKNKEVSLSIRLHPTAASDMRGYMVISLIFQRDAVSLGLGNYGADVWLENLEGQYLAGPNSDEISDHPQLITMLFDVSSNITNDGITITLISREHAADVMTFYFNQKDTK